MRKIFKFFSITICTFILLILIGIITLFIVVKPNDLKPIISNQITKVTGRKFTIQGNIHWSFWPTLGLSIQDAQLANTVQFNQKPFAQVDQARIGIEIFPLFEGKIITDELDIQGLTLNLAKNKQGVSNWNDLFKKKKSQQSLQTTSSTPPQKHKRDFHLIIPKINFKNVTIYWHNLSNNQQTTIDHLNLKAQHIQLNKSFPINISLNVNNNKPKMHGQFTLTSQITIQQKKQTIYAKNLNVTAKLKGNNLPNKKLDAQLNGELLLSKKNLFIRDLKLNLNGTAISGYLKIIDLEKKAGQFNFVIDQLNCNHWLSKKAANQSAHKKSVISKKIAANNKVLYNFLRQLNITGSLKIKHLIVNKIDVHSFKATLKTQNGIMTISPISANFYRGQYNGIKIINVKGNVPFNSNRGTIKNVDFNLLIHDLLGYSNIVGMGNITLNLTYKSFNPRTILKTMNGTVKFSIHNGALKKIDVAYYLRIVRALLNKKSPPKQKGANETEFGALSGTAIIRNGLIACNDLKLISKTITAAGHGTVNLVSKRINYHIDARPIGEATDSLNTAPIIITGNYTKPSISIDTSVIFKKIQKRAIKHLQKKAKEHVKNFLNKQDVNEHVKNILSIFGN